MNVTMLIAMCLHVNPLNPQSTMEPWTASLANGDPPPVAVSSAMDPGGGMEGMEWNVPEPVCRSKQLVGTESSV